MSLVVELWKQKCAEEDRANKEQYVGCAKEIRMHPACFNQLMGELESLTAVTVVSYGKYEIFGIPLVRTTDVEKWEIVI